MRKPCAAHIVLWGCAFATPRLAEALVVLRAVARHLPVSAWSVSSALCEYSPRVCLCLCVCVCVCGCVCTRCRRGGSGILRNNSMTNPYLANISITCQPYSAFSAETQNIPEPLRPGWEAYKWYAAVRHSAPSWPLLETMGPAQAWGARVPRGKRDASACACACVWPAGRFGAQVSRQRRQVHVLCNARVVGHSDVHAATQLSHIDCATDFCRHYPWSISVGRIMVRFCNLPRAPRPAYTVNGR